MQITKNKFVTGKDKFIEENIEKPALQNARLLYILMSVLLVLDWVVPQYFGFHIGFDFTATRVLNIILIIYFILNRKVGNMFLRSMLDVQVTPFLAIYMFVMIYTTILRTNINTFFLNFLDILTFYMIYFGIRYVIGYKKAIKWTVYVAWFLGIYGVIEYILGFSIMGKFLCTLPYSHIVSVYRSGQYRIMGPCGHSIGYGLLLIILIAIICIDYEHDQMYLFNHPALYCLLMLNIFLTGSRGPLGLSFVETLLIIIFSSNTKRKKTLIILGLALIVFILLSIVLAETPVGKYMFLQIASIIDEIFGTDYAAFFGADTTWLDDSSSYRELLPLIFKVEWLNPFLGQGANSTMSFNINDVYIKSIDNFYVALYIRYAYPGMISYILFFIASALCMIKTGFQRHSGLCLSLAIGFIMYCINLLWVDYLQTTKYIYILLAIYAAYYTERKISDKKQKDNL